MSEFDSLLTHVADYVGVGIALFAARKGISEFKISNIEKARENRHKQASAARDALQEVFSNEKARAAMRMLDWSGRPYSDGNTEHFVDFEDLGLALRITDPNFSAKEILIRECFEEFFDHLELLEHYAAIDFLNIDDLTVPLAYYAKKIDSNRPAFKPFLKEYGYKKADTFITRAALLWHERQ